MMNADELVIRRLIMILQALGPTANLDPNQFKMSQESVVWLVWNRTKTFVNLSRVVILNYEAMQAKVFVIDEFLENADAILRLVRKEDVDPDAEHNSMCDEQSRIAQWVLERYGKARTSEYMRHIRKAVAAMRHFQKFETSRDAALKNTKSTRSV